MTGRAQGGHTHDRGGHREDTHMTGRAQGGHSHDREGTGRTHT